MSDKMFYQHSNGSTTLPRGFRFHHEEGPKTPEPLSMDEPRQPSPPRQRLKVRRRNASSLQAPTEHFLASVAAADVPIPTIEIPAAEDSIMVDREEISHTTGFLAPSSYHAQFTSPPKTPVPFLSMDETISDRPDWSMGTPSPSEDYFRPSSALSNASSDDSFYSGSRFSRPSEDGSCTSPESDIGDPFQFPIKSKGKMAAKPLNDKFRSKSSKTALWTKAQSTHLWSTYLVYLQDPTVTPFRIAAGAVPPEGVCHRVARVAKRSWKGPKPRPVRTTRDTEKSGSNTPTGEPVKVYAAWPHSSSATRSHLRDLCRGNTTSVSRHRHLQSRSPTPFTKQIRLRTPEPPFMSSFNTKDIALSLTTSTAETMQPNGPLAKLASETSKFPPFEDFQPLSFGKTRGTDGGRDGRRLASPFVARTYGPSSSNTNEFRPSPPRTQSDVTGPHLRSPLRFDKPRSLNNTQKRRAQHDLEEELSPSGAIVRPSILNEQLFGTPFAQRRVRSRGFSLGDEALRGRPVSEFQRSPFEFRQPVNMNVPPPKMQPLPVPQSTAPPRLLPSATFDPPRLGSPFTENGSNNTFPRRLFPEGTATIRRSAFATMHQTRRSIESFDFGEGPSLQSRLEQLDQKLKQIREREATSKRQSSE